uniref:Uncharacterized protein n=1 Tax=Fervidobacterium nodosum TaxID=2424 RepID=A0A7C5Y3A2_9BACT
MILGERLEQYKEMMNSLEFLEIYPSNLEWNVELGNVFAIDTNILPFYGVVLDVVKRDGSDFVRFAYLTLNLSLASVEAPLLRIKDEPFELVKLTHITGEVLKENLSKISRPLKPVRDVDEIRKYVEKLSGIRYGSIHREFFEMESNFVKMIEEYVNEYSKIIKLPQELFSELNSEFSSLALASSSSKALRFGDVIVVNSAVGTKLFFGDTFANKVGKIFIKGRLIYEGKLTNGLMILNFAKFTSMLNETDIRVEIEETN